MHGYHGYYGNGLLGMGHYYGYGGYIMMGIGLIIFLALIFLVVKKGNLGSLKRNREETPFETLQKRFVNGDITQEEFLQKKETLNKK